MPAPSTKIVLFPKVNSDGTQTVFLRITFARKSKYFSLHRHCQVSEWDATACRFRRAFPEYKAHNDLLRTYEQRAADILLAWERDNRAFSFADFEREMFANAAPPQMESVCGYLRKIDQEMKAQGRFGNGEFYKDLADVVASFRPKATLADMDVQWLHQFEAWMRTTRNLKSGGIGVHLRMLRAACNQAMKKDKIMPSSWYPFAEFSMSHLKTNKVNRAMPLDDVRKLEAAEPTDPTEELARDLFLFSFYCRGMNLADIAALQKEQVEDGRIYYRRKKTHRDYSVALNDKARVIVEKHSARSLDWYVFPVYREGVHETAQQKHDRKGRVAKQVNAALRRLAESCGVGMSGLTFYTARHTYANSLDRMGADRRKIQAALGHSSFKTTETYLNSFSSSEIDDLDNLLR